MIPFRLGNTPPYPDDAFARGVSGIFRSVAHLRTVEALVVDSRYLQHDAKVTCLRQERVLVDVAKKRNALVERAGLPEVLGKGSQPEHRYPHSSSTTRSSENFIGSYWFLNF